MSSIRHGTSSSAAAEYQGCQTMHFSQSQQTNKVGQTCCGGFRWADDSDKRFQEERQQNEQSLFEDQCILAKSTLLKENRQAWQHLKTHETPSANLTAAKTKRTCDVRRHGHSSYLCVSIIMSWVTCGYIISCFYLLICWPVDESVYSPVSC